VRSRRSEQQAGDATPRQKTARKRLLQSLNALVSFAVMPAGVLLFEYPNAYFKYKRRLELKGTNHLQ
jgi:hypothetical protein